MEGFCSIGNAFESLVVPELDLTLWSEKQKQKQGDIPRKCWSTVWKSKSKSSYFFCFFLSASASFSFSISLMYLSISAELNI